MRGFLLIFLVLINFSDKLYAQTESKKTSFGGYIKYMHTLNGTYGFDSLLDYHLLHNRLNFTWIPDENWAINAELRNRMFYGKYVDRMFYFQHMTDESNDQWDLSKWMVDEGPLKMLTEVDRAYVRYTFNKWEFTAGRQRIEWGLNKVWNPNDIFNPYSFFNFDYEERPGSDALKITHFYNYNSKIEFVSKITGDIENYTAGILWKIHQSGYEVQLISGLMEYNIVLGTGWAGNLGKAGFKGEVTYFSALEPLDEDALSGSMSIDYSFGSGFYWLTSYLYNSNGVKDLNLEKMAAYSSFKPLNAKHLLPYSSSIFTYFSVPIKDTFSFSLSIMWFTGDGSSFFGPAVAYNISDKFILDINSQIFNSEKDILLDPVHTQLFLRLKYSF